MHILSDPEPPPAAAAAAFAGGDSGEEFSGRCIAILANGKRCPNAAIPGSRFCGIAAHRELAEREAAGEELEASQVVGGVSDEEEAPAEEVAGEEADNVGAEPQETQPIAEAEPEEPQEAPVEPEVPVAVEEGASEGEKPSAA